MVTAGKHYQFGFWVSGLELQNPASAIANPDERIWHAVEKADVVYLSNPDDPPDHRYELELIRSLAETKMKIAIGSGNVRLRPDRVRSMSGPPSDLVEQRCWTAGVLGGIGEFSRRFT